MLVIGPAICPLTPKSANLTAPRVFINKLSAEKSMNGIVRNKLKIFFL